MVILLVLLLPLLTGAILWFIGNRKVLHALSASSSIILFAATVFTAGRILETGEEGIDFFNRFILIDAYSALLLLITTFVGMLATIYSIGYMEEEIRRQHIDIKKLKIYYSLLHAFMFTMVLTLSTQNMGLLWISVEATTLASAFLVGFYNNKASIEAAWKYIIICSVGIAFALLGIILLYYSSIQVFGQTNQGLNWEFLFENAADLQKSVLRISFIFILIGFGTKAGLAPMHTWLPDAHSQAPSPISAMLSGVLLNTAMYGIVRVLIILNKNQGSSIFSSRILIAFGIISVTTAAIFILVQQDFKRALAYSSIEHMGIIALGLGIFTPLSIFGSVYHTLNHALTKSMLFMASGNIYLKYDTKKINQVQGVLKVMPVTGTVFLLGIFAITGMPPFSIFTSELNIILAAFKESRYITVGLLLLLLVVIFAGFVQGLVKMFYGKTESTDIAVGEYSRIGSVVLVILLVCILVTGIYLPGPLKSLIDTSVLIILGK